MAYDDDRFAILGPFAGGLNNYSNVSAIADNELVECINFVPDIDGSLKCRFPIVETYKNDAGFGNKQVKAIGSGIINSNRYVFFSNASGVWYLLAGAVIPVLIGGTANLNASDAVQYKNEMYFIAEPSSAANGGRWNGAAFTAIASMPKGQAGVIFKERLWIAPGKHAFSNTSRLSFSAIADANTWNGADFFDIAPGDGQNLVDLVIFNNNLLLFKQGSTFYLSYDSKPSDAVVTKISNTIGSSNYRCVVEHQNDIFIMHEENVYQLVNFNWVQINVKVPFVLDTSHPGWTSRYIHTFLSVVGNMLIAKYHNRIYCYNTDTQTWSRWSSTSEALNDFGPLTAMPVDALFETLNGYYAGSSLEFATSIMKINDGYNSSVIEKDLTGNVVISCFLDTKTYTFELPWKFKRLYSWGVECVTNRDVTGIVYPVSVNNPASVPTTIPAFAGPVLSRFYRFPKGLRFREIHFTVTLQSTGATVDGLAQLYKILSVVKTGASTPKAVN